MTPKRTGLHQVRHKIGQPARRKQSSDQATTKQRPRGESPVSRRYPVGAEVLQHGVHFRVWAPRRKQVEVIFESGNGAPGSIVLKPQDGGYFAGLSKAAGAGTRYRLRLDGEPDQTFPDPASRFQPDGPHGSSEVIDPQFNWTDKKWRGVRLEGQVLYEMHVGTFTKEGTWTAAAAQLPELASLGITVLEVMPVADFPGRFGWGYDGVDLYAPTWLYGRPEDFRSFVNTAHELGIGVVLDVVYNHLGPDGNFLKPFSEDYFSKQHGTDWGEAINFDGENCGPVREFYIANAAFWVDEFHLDGLRLDATQDIHDSSPEHILTAITKAVRKKANGRSTLIIGENEPQQTKLIRPIEDGGHGIDALWNDDFHHSAFVALTGHNEAYYSDHLGTAQEFVSSAKYGFLYQGQWYAWQKKGRGSASLDFRPASFINFIQNHDQVANSAHGQRIHKITSPGKLRAMTALQLLLPGTPMIFQGQEFASSKPFRYFSDHKPEVAKLVQKGRAEFLSQFRSLSCPETQRVLADPGNPSTFEACKLDLTERERHSQIYLLHKDLLRLRRTDPVLRSQKKRGVDGAVLAKHCFVLRYFGEGGDDRILLVNFHTDLHYSPSPEPLLAPPARRCWKSLLSTEDPKYGGHGDYKPDAEGEWRIPGQAAVLLAPAEVEEPKPDAKSTGGKNE